MKFVFLLSYFDLFLSSHCMCKVLMLHLITPNDIHTHTHTHTHTHKHTPTINRAPLDEGSARCRDIYLCNHTTFTRDRYQFPLQDSNPQPQQAGGRQDQV